MSVTYDARGRPETITRGQGAAARLTTFGYGPDGFLESLTDPLDQTILFERDDAGRLTRETLPDGEVLALDYDLNGNLSAVTPPGRSSHQFTYSPRDEITAYHPPEVGPLDTPSHFSYNLDGNRPRIDHSDGQASTSEYDTPGRVAEIDIGSRRPVLFV